MVEVDVIRRILADHGDGVFLEVGPWADDPAYVELRTTDKESIEWFGKINVSMSKEMARALGKALIDASND